MCECGGVSASVLKLLYKVEVQNKSQEIHMTIHPHIPTHPHTHPHTHTHTHMHTHAHTHTLTHTQVLHATVAGGGGTMVPSALPSQGTHASHGTPPFLTSTCSTLETTQSYKVGTTSAGTLGREERGRGASPPTMTPDGNTATYPSAVSIVITELASDVCMCSDNN